MDAKTIPEGAKCSQENFSVWGPRSCCSKPAKVDREGRLYCGIHDPVRLKEKRDATDLKWRTQADARVQAIKDSNAKQAALELDAARYRWLRDKARSVDWTRFIGENGLSYESHCRIGGQGMDAAIDAAMKA